MRKQALELVACVIFSLYTFVTSQKFDGPSFVGGKKSVEEIFCIITPCECSVCLFVFFKRLKSSALLNGNFTIVISQVSQ